MRVVPIFPLPETVFFPEVALPLHLFEPRYRQMGEDVIAGDALLVVVLLRPGWEKNYEGTPPVHDVATLGHVEENERLSDDRYNIVLRGLERVRLLPAGASDLAPGKLYRVRSIESAPERHGQPGEAASARIRRRWHEILEMSGQSGRGSFASPESAAFEGLVNHISSFVDVPAQMKQALLEEDDLTSRASRLEGYLDEQLKFWRTLASFRTVKPEDPSVN